MAILCTNILTRQGITQRNLYPVGGLYKTCKVPSVTEQVVKQILKNIQFVSCTMSGAHSIFHLSLSNKMHLERSWEFHYRVTGPYPLMLSLPSGLGLGVQWDLLSREQGRVDPFLWTVLTGLSSCNYVLHFICMTSLEGGALACLSHRKSQFEARPVHVWFVSV